MAAEPGTSPSSVRTRVAHPSGAHASLITATPSSLTVVDVASWLRNLGLERYEAAFREIGPVQETNID